MIFPNVAEMDRLIWKTILGVYLRYPVMWCDVMWCDRLNEEEEEEEEEEEVEEEEEEETSSIFRRLRNGNIPCRSLLNTINFRMIAIFKLCWYHVIECIPLPI